MNTIITRGKWTGCLHSPQGEGEGVLPYSKGGSVRHEYIIYVYYIYYIYAIISLCGRGLNSF